MLSCHGIASKGVDDMYLDNVSYNEMSNDVEYPS